VARLARILSGVALLGVLATLVATLVWILATLGRPLDGVEGDILFEAQRVRRGLTLYVDPLVGAHDYGEPPARYLVLYPPLWSAFLALFPSPIFARIVATGAWLGVLAWIVCRTARERRLATGVFASFIAGTWVLALYGASARPDAVAIALMGVALERSSRLARVDVLCGALFALAAWTKPNVIGAAPGAFLACAIASRPKAILPGIAGAIGVSAIVAGVLSIATGRVWIEHFLASTAQPPSLRLWLEQLATRVPFFALPIAAAIAFGWRRREDASVRIATLALVTSTIWMLVSFAKIGSATNYCMEPCVAVLVLVARVDLPRPSLAFAFLACVQIAWNGTATLKGAIAGIPLARERAAVVANARAICGAGANDVILADEPGLELELNGRIVATPFQTTHRVRRGSYPVAPWIEDVERPEVTCFIAQDDILDRPLDDVIVEHDRLGSELRHALRERFQHVETRAGYRFYRAKR
jgi:hypothetical protein